MDINGEYTIPCDRATVWQALNDPEVLKACIPGCEELSPAAEGEGFEARVVAKIGPVKATFRGAVRLEDIVEAQSYTIVGEGKGGAAGFAKFTSRVTLADAGDATQLAYTADAQLGGKMAQLGARLIQGTARKYADDFFGVFCQRLAPAVEAEPAAEPAAATAAGAPGGSAQAASATASAGLAGVPRWALYGGGAAVLLALLTLLLR